MTELEPYAPPQAVAHFHGRSLTERAKDLAAAYEFGKALSETSFAPAAFRNKPYEAAAAILSGDEVGLSPMQALRSVYVINGTPAMYARAMVALVLSHGHHIWTEEDTPSRVTVCGRRRGSENVERVSWTTERARIAGYTSNKKYVTDPQAMLYARAASDVARRIAPDVLLGLAYSAEEMELSEVETVSLARRGRGGREPDPKPARLARKRLAAVDATEDPEPDLEPADSRVQRPLRRVEDVSLPEPDLEPEVAPERETEPQPLGVGVAAPSPPAAELPPRADGGDRPGYITKAQLKMLHVALGKAGLGDDRDAALALYWEVGGRQVESSKDLTRIEATRIIDHLLAQVEPDGEEPPLDEAGA